MMKIFNFLNIDKCTYIEHIKNGKRKLKHAYVTGRKYLAGSCIKQHV